MGLSNSQYDALMRDYDYRRQANAILSDDRLREVYEALPEIKDIDDRIADAAMASFRGRLSGTADQNLHDTIAELKSQKERLLTTAGYPADYLEPIFDCKDCRDTGFIDGVKCHCFKKAEIRLLYGDSHLGDILQTENFDTFSLEYYSRDIRDRSGKSSREAAAEAFDISRRYAAGDYETKNLILYGEPGTGKTFLSHCIAERFLSRMQSVVYVTAFALTDIFQKRTFEKTTDAKREFEELFSSDLLIIDDLGTEFTNAFTHPVFFQCINERLLQKKHTVISTNMDMRELKETYAERVFSRMMEHYTFIHLFGEDIRMKKKVMG